MASASGATFFFLLVDFLGLVALGLPLAGSPLPLLFSAPSLSAAALLVDGSLHSGVTAGRSGAG